MKNIIFLALAIFLYLNSGAAPGDTTWIQAHTVKQLGASPANFDTMINFPDGSTKYRKVIMIFTLGKYVCPGSPMYCSDWDYTVQTYAMNKLGDTVELGRLITPYANSARMPASWTQPYYFDVTDFATVLRDSNNIRINFSGYSGGFTGDIKFAMIEGTPERNVLGVTKMWAGSYAYGNASNPIDAKVSAKTITAPTGTQAAIYRFNITGHGSDTNYCSEFCSKYYQLLKDGTLVAQKDIWRDNCGLNNFYPQNGTWIYDRANWCPGDVVHTNFHSIPSVTSGSNFNLSMAFEPYTSNGGASYTLFGNVVFYGGINKSLDASLEDIIAPTNNENHYRENGRIGFTTVKIRNSGSTTINNIQFEYGVAGQPSTIATWTGSLSSLTDTIIDLPFAESLLKATGTNLAYEVKVLKVNGLVDDDATNNKISSVFTPVLPLASNAVVILRTNKSLTGTGYSETEWTITDETTGAVVKSRMNNTPETTYNDTLNLPTGVYKFTISDAGCDGLSWWANPSGGSGSILIKPTLYTSYILRGNFGGDFGCGFKQYFRVGNPTDIRYVNAESSANLSVFPNPANDKVIFTIEGIPVTPANIVIRDNFGRVLFSHTIKGNQLEFDAKQFANGLYFVTVYSADNSFPRMQSKFILMK